MIVWLAALALAQSAPASSALEQAYQKEYAYLHAEQVELSGRLAEFDGESERRLAEADAEIASLQARLVELTRRADREEDAFGVLERETSTMDDGDALLADTTRQASETLGLPEPTDPVAAVPAVFRAAAAAMADANAVKWSDGPFFLPDGRRVDGRVLSFGRVAAWGTSSEGSGALAPVGEGRLQLRRDFGRATADALASSTAPDRLELQLFEPERTTEEAEEAGGLGQLLKDSGTMGQILFGLGCVSATLAAVRALTLVFARRGGPRLTESVVAHVRADRLDEARKALGSRRNPLARVLGAILDASDRSREEIDRVVDEALLRELPKVDRFASALVVITAGSPLLGLLGTVTGMIATFDVITEHGTGNPKLMSAGIAEALICTALGLSVAIPTLLAGNVLASVGEAIKNTLERGALALVNALELRDRTLAGNVVAHPARERSA